MGLVKKYKIEILAGLGIILLYFILRVVNLTGVPIFADEAIYIRWAQVMRAEPTLRFLPLSDGKQPLFMWAIIPFFKIFSDPLVAGRMVSVVAGFGTLVGIFLLTQLLTRKIWISFIAALIYAVSPFAVFFDRMALVDSMLAMFGVWTLFFGVAATKKLRLDFAMLTGFALGGALLTKSPALFYSILLPTTSLVSPIFSRKERLLKIFKFIGLLLVTYVIGYAMYNILRLGPNFSSIGARNQDYVLPLSHLWTNPKDPFIFLAHRSLEWIWILGPAALVLLAAMGIFVGLKIYRRETLILASWSLVPILVQAEFAKVFTARYIFFSLPPLIILASLFFSIKTKFTKPLLVLAFMALVSQALFTNWRLIVNLDQSLLPQSERAGYFEEWTAGTGTREVADFVKVYKQKNLDARIVVGTDGFFGTMPDGIQIYIEDIPGITVIGVGITIDQVPESLINAKRAGDAVFLVVNSSRFKGDADQMGLKLVASYPKAKRLETDSREAILYGERDYLYFFEVTERAGTLNGSKN